METTGARKIASTPWAMKERIALIWFSCFCCASAILKLMFRFLASALETVVSAARQPDSEPICEKPMVRSAAWAPAETSAPEKAVASNKALKFIGVSPVGCCRRATGERFPAGNLCHREMGLNSHTV